MWKKEKNKMTEYEIFREKLRKYTGALTKEDTLASNLTYCPSCEEGIPKFITELTEGHCVECYEELRFGKVDPTPNHHRGNPHYGSRDNDPSFENAIKIREK